MGAVVANFEGLKRLFEASELGAYLPTEHAEIGVKILAGFDAILSDATLVTGPIDAALGDAAQRAALERIVATSQQVGALLGEDLPTALGLSVGFSSLDGD